MRIAYFADGPWGHRSLVQLAEMPGIEVVLVVPRADTQDPELKRLADSFGFDFRVVPNVNAPEFLGFLRGRNVDLCVSMSFNQILRSDVLSIPKSGFINCHAGALPFYRGRNVLNWAIINGESEFGVTVHYVDQGIDTGDIILQEMIPIGIDEGYSEILVKAYGACARVLTAAVRSIAEGRATRTPQAAIHPVGFYCTRRLPGDERVDWSWDSKRIHDFVRGIAFPGPCARTFSSRGEILLVKTGLVPGAPAYLGNPGEVVGRDERGIFVKTGDSFLRVFEIADASGIAGCPTFPIGTRFRKEPSAPAGNG